jgi:hypothetical protein
LATPTPLYFLNATVLGLWLYHEAVRGTGALNTLLALVGLLLTFTIAVLPSMDFAYRAPISRSVLETIVSLVAMLLAVLRLGRFRRYLHSGDLALAFAMALLAVAYPVLAALPRL